MPKQKNKSLIQLGFAFHNLGPGQAVYTCITNINRWLEKNYGIDPIIFFEEQSIPCIDAKFARYNLFDTNAYYGNLICTSIDTVFRTQNAHTSKKYYYIYDLEYLRDTNRQNFDKIMQNQSIVKFTRCQDYLDKLTQDGYKINDTIVEDFNIDQILKIINL